jgi:hypothetical protein
LTDLPYCLCIQLTGLYWKATQDVHSRSTEHTFQYNVMPYKFVVVFISSGNLSEIDQGRFLKCKCIVHNHPQPHRMSCYKTVPHSLILHKSTTVSWIRFSVHFLCTCTGIPLLVCTTYDWYSNIVYNFTNHYRTVRTAETPPLNKRNATVSYNSTLDNLPFKKSPHKHDLSPVSIYICCLHATQYGRYVNLLYKC